MCTQWVAVCSHLGPGLGVGAVTHGHKLEYSEWSDFSSVALLNHDMPEHAMNDSCRSWWWWCGRSGGWWVF